MIKFKLNQIVTKEFKLNQINCDRVQIKSNKLP